MAKEKKKERTQSKPKATPPPAATTPPPPSKVNLCPGCIYDFDICGTEEADVQFVNDQDGQRVIKCKNYKTATPPAEPTGNTGAKADQTPPEPPEPPAPTEEAYNCPVDCQFSVASTGPPDNPEVGGCAVEDQVDVPDGTRFDPDPNLPICPKYKPPQETPPSVPVGAKPDEDFGACSCGWPYQRTAYTSKHDAVRCVNPRCNLYRMVQRRVEPLSLAERLARNRGE